MALSDHGVYSGVVDIARNGIDEVIRLKAQAKQAEALIRQMLEALKLAQRQHAVVWTTPCAVNDSAITAAQAWLKENGGQHG